MLPVCVTPADEELLTARDTVRRVMHLPHAA
jgi:hypothetical protein